MRENEPEWLRELVEFLGCHVGRERGEEDCYQLTAYEDLPFEPKLGRVVLTGEV